MGCGILHRAYVIRKENNKYLLDVISPYEALYSSVFGVQADTLSYSQDRMCRRMFDELIDRLNYREKLVIDRLYGYRCDRCSISELAKDLETDEDGIIEIKNSALDRLRDPNNYRYLEKRWYSGTDLTNAEYELDFGGKIRAELLRYLTGCRTDIDIISAVMRKNDISIQRVYRNVSVVSSETGRFETSLSGEKSIDDAVSALKAFKITAKPVGNNKKRRAIRGNVETILITHAGVEQAYKYSGLSDDDIAECVYRVLTDSDEGYGCIINFNISDGLMGLLLLKGYMYLDSLVNDREQIYEDLVRGGFHAKAEEFEKFADKAEIYIADKTHTSMTFVVVPESVALSIYEDVPVDYHELLASAEKTDVEFAIMLIKNVKREFADFSGLTVTDEAKHRLDSLHRDGKSADAV